MTGWTLEVGTAAVARGGDGESGDRHLVLPFAGRTGALLAVVDGLGHGKEAAQAADLALSALRMLPQEPPARLVRRCHEVLRGTRGAVMSIASLDGDRGRMCWLGVGNVWGSLFLSDPRASPRQRYLLLPGGVVGLRLPALQPAVVAVQPGDTLLLASDGIRADLIQDLPGSLPVQRLAEEVLAGYRSGSDDALALVARVARAQSGN